MDLLAESRLLDMISFDRSDPWSKLKDQCFARSWRRGFICNEMYRQVDIEEVEKRRWKGW